MNKKVKSLLFNVLISIVILILVIAIFFIFWINKKTTGNMNEGSLPANPNVAEEQAITEKYEQNAEQLEKLEEELKSLQKKYDELKQKSEAAEMQIGELEEKLKDME